MYCSKCGAAVADNSAFCGACGQTTGVAAAAQRQVDVLPPPPPQPAAHADFFYAGFWLRVVAAIIDNLILAIPEALIGFWVFAGAIPTLIRMPAENPMATAMLLFPRIILTSVILLAGRWLYWSLMESSEWQATVGKKALGLYVTDLEGRRASFARTTGRFFAGRGISIIPTIGFLYYLIDCILAGLTERKQAIHDMIASCLILRKP